MQNAVPDRSRYILILCLVILTVQSASGQFTMPDSVCVGAIRHYWVYGSPGSSYSWAIDGSPLPGNTNEITHAWNSVGNFLVSVQETSQQGCIGSLITGNVVVSSEATSIDSVTTCNSYSWNGATYLTSGIYSAVFPNGSYLGCDSTAILVLTVNPLPTATLSGNNFICEGDTTMLRIDLTGTNPWNVTYSNGSVATTINGIQNSPYLFSVTAPVGTSIYSLSGLSDAVCTATPAQLNGSAIVTALPVPNASFTANVACNKTPVLFTDLSSGNGNNIILWHWNFGDGNQATYTTYTPVISHVYSQAGIFNVILTVSTSNGCESSFQQLIMVAPTPVSQFSYKNTCQGETTQFYDLSLATGSVSIVSWSWNFGDPGSGMSNTSNLQNPVHIYNSPGQYMVSLITTNSGGCNDTVMNPVTIHVKPPVEFYHDSITCHTTPITFFADPTITNIPAIQSYDWDFGDGTPHSNQQNPSHTYALPGLYVVTLSIIDTSGCENAISHEITIHEGPTTAFSYDQSCLHTATQFTDHSLPPANGTIVSWNWNFGVNGSISDTSSLQNPTFTYPYPGTYTVILTTTTNNGCTNTISKPVQIWNTPEANFRYSTTPCSNGSVQFQDSSFSFQATITEWLWEFEPYQYSTNRNPGYSYYEVDTCYDVRLIVTDLHGCMDTIVKPVCIPAAFTLDIQHQSTCYGSPTLFSPELLTPGGDEVISAVWDFGDPASGSNNTSTSINASHTFTSTGFFTVNLTAIDKFGCQSSVVKTIEVFSLPMASFNWNNNPFSNIVGFTSTSTIGGAAIASYTWNFGDGTIQTYLPPTNTATHTYTNPGYYSVTLTITDKNGCTSTTSQMVLCNPSPQAAMEVTDTLICQNVPITIANRSSGSIDQWIWNWGDGTAPMVHTTYQPTLTHTYTQPGSYILSLKIITIYNGSPIADSTGRMIIVKPSPDAGFVTDKHCYGERTMFYDTTNSNGAAWMRYSWNFGDPVSLSDTSTRRNPGYIYSSTGLFNVRLIATNHFGCSDTANRQVKVNGLPNAQFNHSIACIGNQTHFFEHAEAFEEPVIHWGWRIGDDKILGWMNGPSPNFTFDSTGVYWVQLAVTDANGCMDTTSLNVPVYPSPLSAFSIEENIGNEQGRIQFINGSIDGEEYYWELGNGEISSEESPIFKYDADGEYIIRLYTTNAYGCTDSASYLYNMLYKGLYVPSAFAPGGPVQSVRYWKPVGINLAYYKAEIYNRWEGLIWSSTKLDENGSPVEGWDGSYKGGPCQQGVYVWKITAIFRDGTIWQNDDTGNHLNMPEQTSGTITLIR